MSDASADNVRTDGVSGGRIKFFADMLAPLSAYIAKHQRAIDKINPVAGLGQMPVVSCCPQDELSPGIYFKASGEVYDILPADLIGKSGLIVWCWIDLIKGSAASIARCFVA